MEKKMQFDDILKKRKTVFSWDEKIPSKNDIDIIINSLHDYSPSKQSKCRYKLHVYKNDDEEKMMKIYQSVKADSWEDKPEGRFNPQVLAPWLLIFEERHTGDEEDGAKAIYRDIGIAAVHIGYKAIDLGMGVGYCACFREDMAHHFSEVFDFTPELIIGVGYDSGKDKYWCPHFKKFLDLPYRDIKPRKDEYIRYIGDPIIDL